MNMRQHKHRVQLKMFINRPWWLVEAREVPVFNAPTLDIAVDAPVQEFVCQKVKDGSWVATFLRREDALALLNKHAKQRKAKLQVLNSLTGELEVFSEEELA